MNIIRANQGYRSTACFDKAHEECLGKAFTVDSPDLVPCGCPCHGVVEMEPRVESFEEVYWRKLYGGQWSITPCPGCGSYDCRCDSGGI